MKKLFLFTAVACSALIVFAHDAAKPGVIGLDVEGNLVRQTVWNKHGKDAAPIFKDGIVSFVTENAKPQQGLMTTIIMNQVEAKPIVFGVESKAENVSGQTGGDFSFYLDIVYTDDTKKFGVIAPCKVGTADWEKTEKRFVPEKPVKSVRAHLLFRNKTGNAYFRNAFLNEESK